MAAILPSAVLAARDNRAGVAHAASGRRRCTRDEAHDWLAHIFGDPSSSLFSAVPPISPIIRQRQYRGRR